MSDEIVFDATVYKVSTLVDQGLRVTLDLPETALIAAAQLMGVKRQGMILHVTAKMETPLKAGNENAIQKGSIRKSQRAAS